ncbi:MAG: PAS domain S-box protein, partial [Bacteroidetes bacterium]|nr:PAS domain S-box protein [Bacteroidota bacterium]
MDNYSDKSKEQLIAEIESLKVQVQTNQKQADQKASDGDELYRIIADFSDDLIAITSFDKNSKYIYVSPSHKRSLGYSEEEMLGKSGFDFVHPADKSKLFVLLKSYLKKKLTKVFTGKEIDTVEKIVYRVKHKNGHWITIESIAKVIDKNKVLFFSRDLTDNIKAGMSLKNSEEKFRNAFHTSPDSVCINRLVDGMYVEINAGFTNILGYHKRDVEGRTSQELNIWADVNDRKKLLAGLKKNGIVENMEARFVNKSGDTKIGLMSASIIDLFGEDHILSITRDVTEHKGLQRDWENIFMAISAPTVILDTQFKILEANRATLELSGLTADKIYGKHCYEVFHKKGNDCPADGCPLKKILEKADNRTVEMEMEAFDGTYLVNCTPILDEVGNVEKIIHIRLSTFGTPNGLKKGGIPFDGPCINIPRCIKTKPFQQLFR